MGLVYAEIELINADDMALARRRIIGEEEVKRMWINPIVIPFRQLLDFFGKRLAISLREIWRVAS